MCCTALLLARLLCPPERACACKITNFLADLIYLAHFWRKIVAININRMVFLWSLPVCSHVFASDTQQWWNGNFTEVLRECVFDVAKWK